MKKLIFGGLMLIGIGLSYKSDEAKANAIKCGHFGKLKWVDPCLCRQLDCNVNGTDFCWEIPCNQN